MVWEENKTKQKTDGGYFRVSVLHELITAYLCVNMSEYCRRKYANKYNVYLLFYHICPDEGGQWERGSIYVEIYHSSILGFWKFNNSPPPRKYLTRQLASHETAYLSALLSKLRTPFCPTSPSERLLGISVKKWWKVARIHGHATLKICMVTSIVLLSHKWFLVRYEVTNK